MIKILLIVPCFNEADRIDLESFNAGKEWLLQRGIELTFLFADDGSRDSTLELLKRHANSQGDLVYSAPQNLGKANVIHAAFHSLKPEQVAEFHWIGYWDADLATPLREIEYMLRFLELGPANNYSSIWGSRLSRLGSDIQRKAYRHYLGRIFITVVSTLLGVKAYDSQCGAKLFTPKAADVAFASPFISRWIFDVEILLRLQETSILECPLTQWRDVPGSKVRIFREMFRVSVDLLKIKRVYHR